MDIGSMGSPLNASELRQELLRTLRDADWAFPVSRGNDIYVSAFSGNGARFAGEFAVTWQRLPIWARRRIRKHWRSVDFSRTGMVLSPSIELVDDWSGREGEGVKGDYAETGVLGHRLRFHAPAVDVMPADVVQDLIAHELAHVLQLADGLVPTDRSPEGINQWRVIRTGEIWQPVDIEEDADISMEMWGFNSYSIDEWAVAQGIVQRIENPLRDQMLAALDRIMRRGR